MATLAYPRHYHALDADEVISGLRAPHKRLPGEVVDVEAREIEAALLADNAMNLAHQVGPLARVIELGGTVAARALLDALDRPREYVAFDARDKELPVPQHQYATTLLYLPHNQIGAMEPGEARRQLSRLAQLAGPDRLLLVGADATRDEVGEVDENAGRDALEKLNQTRHATFDVGAFQQRAVWNPTSSRVELSVVSTARQVVQLDDEVIALQAGEAIELAHSYKHTPAAMQAILVGAGWRLRQVFTSRLRPVRLWLCEPMR